MTHPTQSAAELYAAILREPWDDAPRMAYADEVDGYEPEFAEFIRVQIELAKQPWNRRINDSRYSSGEPWDSLRDRQTELWGYLPKRNGVMWQLDVEQPDFAFLLPNDNKVGITNEYPHAVVSRGFVSAVAVSMSRLMGTCERCENGFSARIDLASDPDMSLNIVCGHCKGFGRTTALIDTLCGTWPVERVTVTTAEPAEWSEESGENRYVWTKRDNDLIEVPNDIPLVLFNQLTGGVLNRGIWLRRYPTREAALDALSAAIIAESRERAGLPGRR